LTKYKRDKVKGYISIILSDDLDSEDAIFKINKLEYFMGNKGKFLNLGDSIIGHQILPFTPLQLEDFLCGDEELELEVKDKVGSLYNSIAYDLIRNNYFEKNVTELIESSIKLQFNSSYPTATFGYWYLKNEKIALDTSLEKGENYYKKAIEIEESLDGEDVENITQKMYFELALFSLNRLKNVNKASEYIELALEIGETGVFYKDALELKEKYLLTFEQIATDREIEAIDRSELSDDDNRNT
jgi:tetratricopeptide (TPR) repeat protein